MQRHAELIDWWAASGRAQSLEIGWLAFTEDEVRHAVHSGPDGAAERMGDWRWFHGIQRRHHRAYSSVSTTRQANTARPGASR